MRYTKECLYDVNWQVLRVSLLNTWNNEDAKVSLQKLRDYVDDKGPDSPERIWRGLNLLNAVLLALGKKRPTYYTQIVAMRDSLSIAHSHNGFMLQGRQWDWKLVGEDLKTVCFPTLRLLVLDLGKRIKTSMKRNGHTNNRPELIRFTGLLEAEYALRINSQRRTG